MKNWIHLLVAVAAASVALVQVATVALERLARLGAMALDQEMTELVRN